MSSSYAKLLSGSSCRLRATSKIGEVTRDSSLLPKFRIALAEACRAGTRDGWRSGHESNPVAMLLPLRDKPSTYPVDYRERVAAPHSLFDIVRCKARALVEQMDDPGAKRTDRG